MNAVMIAVIVMLALSLARVHVVLSLLLAALVGGLLSGMGLHQTMVSFQDGLAGGAKIALSYAMLGAFAVAISHSYFQPKSNPYSYCVHSFDYPTVIIGVWTTTT